MVKKKLLVYCVLALYGREVYAMVKHVDHLPDISAVRVESLLELGKILLKNKEFDKAVQHLLKGFIMHAGTAQSGHYIAYVKNDGVWYKCNDEYVISVPNDVINTILQRGCSSGVPYFLPTFFFYEKV